MSTTHIYVKTPKGIEEITNNTYGLAHRARRVLIMVDGKRDNEDITVMFTNTNTESILTDLIRQGFIVPLQSLNATPASSNGSKGTFEPAMDESKRFEMAKNFMCNTVKAFHGSMGSGLTNQIEKCSTLDELRLHYKPWREAIVMTSDGRKQVSDLEKRLAALLS